MTAKAKTSSWLSSWMAYAIFAVVNVLVSYGLLLFLANTLSKSDYALYGLLTSVMSLVLILANFGQKEAYFKFASKEDHTMLGKLGGTSVFWLSGFAALAVVSLFFSFSVGLAALAFLVLLALTIVNSIHRGFGIYLKDAISIPLYRALWLAGAFAVFLYSDALSVEAVFASALLAGVIAILVLVSKRTFSAVTVAERSLPFNHPVLWHFMLLELVSVAYLRVDMLFLQAFSIPAEQIADYFLGVQLFDAAILVLMPVSYLFFNAINKNTALNMKLALWRFTGFQLALAGAVVVGWLLLGSWFLQLMFPEFTDSWLPVLILFAGLVPASVTMLLSHLLFHWNDETIYLKVCFTSLVLCIVLQLLLIPWFQSGVFHSELVHSREAQGELGAAIARFVTEAVILVLLAFYVVHHRSRFSRGHS